MRLDPRWIEEATMGLQSCGYFQRCIYTEGSILGEVIRGSKCQDVMHQLRLFSRTVRKILHIDALKIYKAYAC